MSLEKISEALTHPNIGTTRVYVNASNVVALTPANFAYDNLNKNSRGDSVGDSGGDFHKKRHPRKCGCLVNVDITTINVLKIVMLYGLS